MSSWFKRLACYWPLFLIFFLALFLRFYRLETLPANFHEDEVLSGYVGRFIIQNGKDLYGNSWPLWYFNKFGDYYIIGPIYLSGLSTLIFGVTQFATRFPAALFGSLLVFPVYFFAQTIFNKKRVSLISSFLIAILPWQIVLSRSTTEGVIGATLFLTSVVFLFYSLKSNRAGFLIASVIFGFSSYLIYHPYRVYLPLTYLGFIIIFFKDLRKNKKLLVELLITTLLFFGLSYYISTTDWGRGRFGQTSIFGVISGVTIRLNEMIADEGQNKILIARIFHNKLIGYGREFVAQYLTYFSLPFLFINGWNNSRYFVPEQGLLYFSFLILVLTALIGIYEKPYFGKNIFLFFIFLLLLSPLPAALTVVESPNVHRSLFLGILLAIIAGIGFDDLTKIKIKKIPLSSIITILLLGEFIFFWHQYSRHTDYFSSLKRNDGQKQIVIFAGQNTKKYQTIYLPAPAAMSWYYLFFNRDFDQKYIGQFRLDSRIDKTGKIEYIESDCPSSQLKPSQFEHKKIMVIDFPNCASSDRFKQIKTIRGTNPLLNFKILIPK